MLILIAIALMFFTPLLIAALSLSRSRFLYQWWIAVGTAAIAWLLVFLSRPESAFPGEAMQTLLLIGNQAILPDLEPAMLLVDGLSWPFALAIVTLALAVMLTETARPGQVDWRIWAEALALSALGLAAALAANLTTLMLAWTALDVSEVWILLAQVRQSRERERIVVAFSGRVLGTLLLIVASLVSYSYGVELTFTSIPLPASIFLLMSAAFRLGVLPLQAPFLVDVPLQRGIGTSLRLIPAAASLALLSRAALFGSSPALTPYLLLFAGIASVYSGLAWISAPSELAGRPFWITGMASLAVSAAVRAHSEACLAWGIASIFSGGLLFMASPRYSRLIPLLSLGMLGFSALPFTPAWAGAQLYLPDQQLAAQFLLWSSFILILVGHILLLYGYLHHTFRLDESPVGGTVGLRLIYPLGLAILPVVHFLIGWLDPPAAALSFPFGWIGLAEVVVVIVVWLWRRRGPTVAPLERTLVEGRTWGATFWGGLLSLRWLYRLTWALYERVGQIVSWLSIILEGEGGVLWTLFLLVLLMTLAAPVSTGR